MDGYFIWTDSVGARIWASDLNSTAVNALSFATAESKPDALVRGIAWDGRFYAMGSSASKFGSTGLYPPSRWREPRR
jgi:hypothetical protein